MPGVSLEAVWVDYRAPRRVRLFKHPRIWALQDVSITVEPGASLGVIGGNGSGKTTLLRTMGGVFVPTSGGARVSGRIASVVDLTPGQQRDLNGHENLQIEAALLGIDSSEMERIYPEVLDLAALPPEVLEEPIYMYSSGMQLRLRLALAIACEPDVLVVDEVLAVADARFQERYLARMGELLKRGTSLVLASHNLDVIAEHTERAVVLDAGRVVLSGPSPQVVAHYERALAEELPPGPDTADPGRTGPGDAPEASKGTLAERLARTGS
jgi:homopolymeric O-antigen transport system ATP-binding protein